MNNKLDPRICTHCGKPVPRKNDLVWLQVCLGKLSAINEQSSHLLPEGGCPGSRFWAQYLDSSLTRTENFDPALTIPVKRAFEKIKKLS